jgi:hypothetical protein
MSSPPAKSKMPPIGGPTGPKTRGIKPPNSRQNQTQDSGGNIFNPVQKPISNITPTANIPLGGGTQPGSGYPGMNVSAAGTMGAGQGKTNRKVAGFQKFYGK